MIPGALPTRRVESRALEDVLVTSRYLLVAQAIETALHRRDLHTRLVAWGTPLGHLPATTIAHSVMLLLDELDTRIAIDLVAGVVTASPVKVLVLTGRPPGPSWGGVLAAGAAGICHSATSLDALETLLTAVAAGEPVMADDLREGLLRQWHDWLEEEIRLRSRVALLSPREATVLGFLAQGLRVVQISEHLGVSEATVRSQVKSVRRKLKVDSQLGAVAIARRLSGEMPDAGSLIPLPRNGGD